MFNVTNHQGNADQNHNETSLHACQDGYYIKNKTKQETTSVGKNVEKLEPLHSVGRNAKWYNCYGEQYGAFSEN